MSANTRISWIYKISRLALVALYIAIPMAFLLATHLEASATPEKGSPYWHSHATLEQKQDHYEDVCLKLGYSFIENEAMLRCVQSQIHQADRKAYYRYSILSGHPNKTLYKE